MKRAAFLCLLFLTSCAVPTGKPERVALTPVAFSDLDGWQRDAPASALAAFQRSCAVLSGKTSILAGRTVTWTAACATARQTAVTDATARAFFETHFRPYAVGGADGFTGLFTGYYVPELRGSLRREGAYQTPIYGRPADKIDVDLGLFKMALQGQHITGKIEQGSLVPYDDRAAISAGSLGDRAPVVAWVDDPVGLFFLQVQGSGRLRLDDGSVIPIGYDGANGRAYVAIGRVLADQGAVARPVTMPEIRCWLAAHADRAAEVMNANPSYVFFRRLTSDEVPGAQGVILTPERSLAVDASVLPLGAPVWLETTDGQGAPLHRLLIAQDTGGAIKGVVRGDVFWGASLTAEAQAGAMQSLGRYYVLLPEE
jgi:membrane-bound lytic murein transglycosylase A